MNLYMINPNSTTSTTSATTTSTMTSLATSIIPTSTTPIATSTLTTSTTVSPTPTPITVQTLSGWSYLGCYSELPNGRALSALENPIPAANVSIENCAAACSAYTYFGVEYAQECYCGNIIGSPSRLVAGSTVAATGCNMVCVANATVSLNNSLLVIALAELSRNTAVEAYDLICTRRLFRQCLPQ